MKAFSLIAVMVTVLVLLLAFPIALAQEATPVAGAVVEQVVPPAGPGMIVRILEHPMVILAIGALIVIVGQKMHKVAPALTQRLIKHEHLLRNAVKRAEVIAGKKGNDKLQYALDYVLKRWPTLEQRDATKKDVEDIKRALSFIKEEIEDDETDITILSAKQKELRG